MFDTANKESVIEHICAGDTKEATVSKSIQTIVDDSKKHQAEHSAQTIYHSQNLGRGLKLKLKSL